MTRGVGNGVGDGLEGVTQGSVIGTYMHGPVLARNPELADLLLKRALGVTNSRRSIYPKWICCAASVAGALSRNRPHLTG